MNKFYLLSLALSVATVSASSLALEFDTPLSASVRVNPAASKDLAGFNQDQPLKKSVSLMNIRLSTSQKLILTHFPLVFSKASLMAGLPRQAAVSMNGVPVLDQGRHGSCVTFAATAALDALLGKGDYISQLCHLQLGSYLEQKGYIPSGWTGSTGPMVINQLFAFGVMNKNNQRAKSCGGLREYPLANSNTLGSPMPLDEFKEASENLNDSFYWEPLLKFNQRFQWNPAKSDKADSLLIAVKKSLASSPDARITFGVLLPVDYCSAGACASYQAEEDTWALTQAIVSETNPTFGGHEMIIIGYDDDAIATDHEGVKHQGLLTIRNSWGSNAGDHGNYYMSYDFFKQFAVEVQELVRFKNYP